MLLKVDFQKLTQVFMNLESHAHTIQI